MRRTRTVAVSVRLNHADESTTVETPSPNAHRSPAARAFLELAAVVCANVVLELPQAA